MLIITFYNILSYYRNMNRETSNRALVSRKFINILHVYIILFDRHSFFTFHFLENTIYCGLN